MSVYGEFFTKFLAPLFEGLMKIIVGIGQGLFQMFNIVNYITVVGDYKKDLGGLGILVVILSVIFLVISGLFFITKSCLHSKAILIAS